MDVKSKRTKTNRNPQRRTRTHISLPASKPATWMMQCPTGEAGALNHNTKYAHGPGVRETAGGPRGD